MDTTSQRSRRRTWALGLGVVAVTALAAVAVVLNGNGVPDPSDNPGPGIGLCVESYSAETLAGRDFAFDGTVTAFDGDTATFQVNESFRGGFTGSVKLDAPGMTGNSITTAGGPPLVDGERFLVAGDDGFVWGCGFTQPYDEGVAAEWAEATR